MFHASDRRRIFGYLTVACVLPCFIVFHFLAVVSIVSLLSSCCISVVSLSSCCLPVVDMFHCRFATLPFGAFLFLSGTGHIDVVDSAPHIDPWPGSGSGTPNHILKLGITPIMLGDEVVDRCNVRHSDGGIPSLVRDIELCPLLPEPCWVRLGLFEHGPFVHTMLACVGFAAILQNDALRGMRHLGQGVLVECSAQMPDVHLV